MRKFAYLERVSTEDGICDTKVRISIDKDAFQKLFILISNRRPKEMSTETLRNIRPPIWGIMLDNLIKDEDKKCLF